MLIQGDPSSLPHQSQPDNATQHPQPNEPQAAEEPKE